MTPNSYFERYGRCPGGLNTKTQRTQKHLLTLLYEGDLVVRGGEKSERLLWNFCPGPVDLYVRPYAHTYVSLCV